MPSRRAQRLLEDLKLKAERQQQVAKKAVGYVRVSTEEQAAEGYGLDYQERAIRAFAESQGYELVEVVHDAGVSGASRPESRPGFSRVIQLAQQGAFSVLLVWKFDRLARSLVYAVTAANDLRERYGVVLRSVTEPIDTSTPMGETIFAILAGMAAQERRAITERTWAGRLEKARRGGFAGGEPPLGYRRDKEGGLAIDDEAAATVRRIFRLRAEGKSLHEIARILNAEGVPTKRGGQWAAATVRYILDNPKYRGQVEYLFRWNGQEYVLREGTHPPLIREAV